MAAATLLWSVWMRGGSLVRRQRGGARPRGFVGVVDGSAGGRTDGQPAAPAGSRLKQHKTKDVGPSDRDEVHVCHSRLHGLLVGLFVYLFIWWAGRLYALSENIPFRPPFEASPSCKAQFYLLAMKKKRKEKMSE